MSVHRHVVLGLEIEIIDLLWSNSGAEALFEIQSKPNAVPIRAGYDGGFQDRLSPALCPPLCAFQQNSNI